LSGGGVVEGAICPCHAVILPTIIGVLGDGDAVVKTFTELRSWRSSNTVTVTLTAVTHGTTNTSNYYNTHTHIIIIIIIVVIISSIIINKGRAT